LVSIVLRDCWVGGYLDETCSCYSDKFDSPWIFEEIGMCMDESDEEIHLPHPDLVCV